MKKLGQNETKETKDQQQKIQMVSKTHQIFTLRDRKKVTISRLLQKVCMRWRFSPIINR